MTFDMKNFSTILTLILKNQNMSNSQPFMKCQSGFPVKTILTKQSFFLQKFFIFIRKLR